MKRIEYTLEKHHNLWTIWRTTYDHGIGFYGIFSDENPKECKKWAKERGIELGKHKKSNSKRKDKSKKEL